MKPSEGRKRVVIEEIQPQIDGGRYPAKRVVGDTVTVTATRRSEPLQKVPVAVYRIDLNFNATPFINDMMNATGIAIGLGQGA